MQMKILTEVKTLWVIKKESIINRADNMKTLKSKITCNNVMVAVGVIAFLHLFYDLVVVSFGIFFVFCLPLMLLRWIITFVFSRVAENAAVKQIIKN